MDKFFINLAIVKVNLDESKKDILDNYIPLVSHTLSQSRSETISLEEFIPLFREATSLDMPISVIDTLLKRVSRQRHGGLLQKQENGHYKIIWKHVRDENYAQVRDARKREYNQLKDSFHNYCNRHKFEIGYTDTDQYFFEILYEIAPNLFRSISQIQSIDLNPTGKQHNKYRYFVGRFLQHINKTDQTSFEIALSFVQGAMLTETFYYSDPQHISEKMRDTKVFFDTQFLLDALGYCGQEYSESCKELVNILQGQNVKMRLFQHTYNEMRSILLSVKESLERSRYKKSSPYPGSVLDYFIRRNGKPSDVELVLNSLKRKLEDMEIKIEQKPKRTEENTINENKLENMLKEEFDTQSDAARTHDIDCLSSIHMLRKGKAQYKLESCRAIFITTNNRLAMTAKKFFEEEYKGNEKTPICMGHYIFTTLVWLKNVRKQPDLPKVQLVASCYAATQPKSNLWEKYIKEADRLKSQCSVNEDDYIALVYSSLTYESLMEVTLGNNELTGDDVKKVLKKIKKNYTRDLEEKIGEKELELNTMRKNHESIGEKVEKWVTRIVGGSFVLGFFLLIGLPFCFFPLAVVPIVLAVLALITGFFDVFKFGFCKKLAKECGCMARKKVISLLSRK